MTILKTFCNAIHCLTNTVKLVFNGNPREDQKSVSFLNEGSLCSHVNLYIESVSVFAYSKVVCDYKFAFYTERTVDMEKCSIMHKHFSFENKILSENICYFSHL